MIKEALIFFLYDSFKILLLLFCMIFVIGFFRTFVSQSAIRNLLGRFGFFGYFLASFFGAITPFCSCSSIPLFISFIDAGVPLGVCFSFLVTSPLVNEFVAVLMLGFFGWKVTLFYIVAGILIGVFSGFILGKMKLDHLLVKDFQAHYSHKDVHFSSLKSRLAYGFSEAKSIVRKVWLWVLVGVGIGALIHNFVPALLIENVISELGFFGVPLAVLIGVPMYGNGSAILPIAAELFNKGVPLGTALAFMMSIVGLSFPEAVILRRVMSLKLIGIFFGIVALGIMLIGFLLNLFY